jgi:hypothetical protein
MNPMLPFNQPQFPGTGMSQDQMLQALMSILGGLGGPTNHLTPGMMPPAPQPAAPQRMPPPLLGGINV